MSTQHYDVLILGAGISGIGMACHLAQKCPDQRYAILERRRAIGGTWDLFRYPGIRSDSDVVSFGYRFRPWTGTKILADGASIRAYVNDTAREFGVADKVHFGLKVTRADWSGADQRWTVSAVDEALGEPRVFSCRWLVSATGYYDHDAGFTPDYPGIETFGGRFVHPQQWPEDLDYAGKRVVVIGSGATAVTLIPAMAEQTAHITMLQRSPSYVYSVPMSDKVGEALAKVLPQRWLYPLTRRRNIFLQRSIYKLSRRFPQQMKALLLRGVRKQIGDGVDMRHFTPRYMPWDERLCAVPDGDLFKAIRAGQASVVTDHIERFTGKGILLKSGRELEADIIVSATGLKLQNLGGMELFVDGQPRRMGERMTYKGLMLQDIPNMAYLFGYINISWTLKVDQAADYVCRLLDEMKRRGVGVVTPRAPQGEMQAESVMAGLQSGYVKRAEAGLPRQGRALPWRVLHHYEKDSAMYRAPVADAQALEWVAAA